MNEFKAFDDIFDSVLVLNDQRDIIYFNYQATVFFKLPPRLLRMRKKTHELFNTPQFDFSHWLEGAIHSNETHPSPEINLSLVQTAGVEYFVVMKLVPLLQEGASHYALILHDMTIEIGLHSKYREQVEELKKTHSQILQADKLATIGELTANISHEISNPLTIAAGQSDIIKTYLSLPSPLEKLGKITASNESVIKSLERVNQIIKNMKDFLRKSEDKKEYCSVNAIVEDAVKWVLPILEKNSIKVELDFKLQAVALVNRLKIEQVVINLLKNSAEAIAESQGDEDKIIVRISKSDDGEETWIDFIDYGPGMAEAIKLNLFKPFQSTKDAGNGTGLGLSICSKIIESHTGKLQLLDSMKGCHFRISLPLIELYSITQNDHSHSSSIKKKRVLVLDDDVMMLNALNSLIADMDFVFVGSTDPHDALVLIQRAVIDLILVDIDRLNEKGSEFAERARQEGFKGRIIYLENANNQHQFRLDEKKLNLSGLIAMPFTKEEACELIRLTLELSEGIR